MIEGIWISGSLLDIFFSHGDIFYLPNPFDISTFPGNISSNDAVAFPYWVSTTLGVP
jgi:hypothetical protein